MSNDKKTSTADGLTRRGFLTLGGVAALGAGAALAGCSPQASSASGTDNAAVSYTHLCRGKERRKQQQRRAKANGGFGGEPA